MELLIRQVKSAFLSLLSVISRFRDFWLACAHYADGLFPGHSRIYRD